MSAVVAETLAFDFTAAAAGAQQFVSSRASVYAYIDAIRAVAVGPQPIVIGGQPSGTFDPLQNLPDVASGVHAAKYHADAVAQQLDFLHGWAQGHIRGAVDLVLGPVKTMRDIFVAVPSGGTLTEEQIGQIGGQMYAAKFMTGMLASTARQTRQGIQDFLTQLPNDHKALSDGPYALARVRGKIESDFRDLAMKYIFNPVTAGIGNVILQIGGQFLKSVDKLSGTLSTALQGHEAMRSGIGAFATGIEAVMDKYVLGEKALYKADRETATVALRRFDLNRAVSSWEQLRDFVLNSGF
jgi:hypothetical protein